MTKPQRLTKTQRIILLAATEMGSVAFGAGDRRGTRIRGRDELGRPIVIAYAQPEHFLQSRGLLAQGNEPYVYRITEAGRKAIEKTRARAARETRS